MRAASCALGMHNVVCIILSASSLHGILQLLCNPCSITCDHPRRLASCTQKRWDYVPNSMILQMFHHRRLGVCCRQDDDFIYIGSSSSPCSMKYFTLFVSIVELPTRPAWNLAMPAAVLEPSSRLALVLVTYNQPRRRAEKVQV